MSWKDEYREEKEASGLTWSEYHDRHFVHVSELDTAGQTLAELRDHVEACTNEYEDLKREFAEVRILLESEDHDP